MSSTVTLKKAGAPGFGFSITGGFPSDIVVSKVSPNSPADGKLHVGDRIDSLNGQSVHGLHQPKVVFIVKGAGEELTVTFRRASSDSTSPMMPRKSVDSTPAEKPAPTPKPAAPVTKKPAAPKPAPKLASKPAPVPSVNAAPSADEVARANAAISRVIAATEKLGISVSDDTSLPIEKRLAAVVDQLESGTSDDALALKRLAAVVLRLENVASSLGVPPTNAKPTGASLETIVSRIEQSANAITGTTASTANNSSNSSNPDADLRFERHAMSAGGELEEEHESMIAYDEILQTQLRKYLDISRDIGGDVAGHAELVKHAFIAQRLFMSIVPAASKPGPKVYPLLTEATKNAVRAIVDFKEAHMSGPHSNHMLVVAEAIPSFGWLDMGEKPAPFIREMTDCAEFFANRIMKEFKEKDPRHAEWAKAFLALFRELTAYVKKYHPTGLVWGKKTRSMTFWSNAIAQTAPGEGDADKYVFNSKLGVPTTVSQ